MGKDIVADSLNEIMNAKIAGKKSLVVNKNSKLLRNVLNIAKNFGYLDYSIEDNKIRIEIKKLNEIRAIKPRFDVSVKKIEKYERRFLPAKDFGFLIISTNKGLMTNYEAKEKNIGGCLIAYFY